MCRPGPVSNRLSEFGQGKRERRDRDGGEQEPEGPTRAWMHKGVEVVPL
jgi:hypothetical protein